METIVRYNEDALYRLRRRKIALGEMTGEITGYPSIDMPWLKYYTEEQILAPIPNMSALDYLKVLNNNNLNLPAIEFLGQQITYLELFKKINDTAKSLHALGVKPGEIVTVILPACPEEVYLFYAIDQIGACANFIFPGTPLTEVEKTMEEFNSTNLIILEDILMQPNNLVNNPKYNIVTTSLAGEYKIQEKNTRTWSDFEEQGKKVEPPLYKRNQEEPLFIAKTGGSTGKPKRVILADRSFNLQAHQHLNTIQKQANGDRWLRLWPMFSASAAVSSNHLPLCIGMTLVLEPMFDLTKMDEIILRTKPSHMPLIASCLDSLINSDKIKQNGLSFMKSIGCGGEAMTEEFETKANKFAKDNQIEPFVRIGYGMTENGSGATVRFSEETFEFGGTGIPQLNTIVSIFDVESGKELKYGEEGEVCILSETFMLGYHNDVDSTNAVLRTHSDGKKWLHSGDLGYMNENGQLFIKGRLKRVISLFNGQKIYPLDLETVIETIEDVERAIIIPEIDNDHLGFVKPCCFIVLKDGSAMTQKELLQIINNECLKNAPDYVRIDTIHIISNIPLNAAGKADLQLLEEKAMVLSKKKQ